MGLLRLRRRALLTLLPVSLKQRPLRLMQQALPLLQSLSKNLPRRILITRLKKLKKLPTLPLLLRPPRLMLHRRLLLRLVLLLVLKLRRASLPLLLLRRQLLGMLLRLLRLPLLGLPPPLRPLRLMLLNLRLPLIRIAPRRLHKLVQRLRALPRRRLPVTLLSSHSRQLRLLRLMRISIDRLLPLASLTRRLIRLTPGRVLLLPHQVLLKLKVMRIVLR